MTERIGTDASDYFLYQNKRLALETRRPLIRRPADLVGPGIAPNAVRLTNFNDLLATFDGYFSAVPGATNAPNGTDVFVGTVTSDAALGGWQSFRSLDTGTVYERLFTRHPLDPEAIAWGAWTTPVASLDTRLDALEAASTAVRSEATSVYAGAAQSVPANTTSYSSLSGNTCSIVFTAPPSGKVLLFMGAALVFDATGMAVAAIVKTGSTVGAGTTVVAADDSYALIVNGSGSDNLFGGSATPRLITGLTPGDPYNAYMVYRNQHTVAQNASVRSITILPIM
jgi:hypothetical protein